MKFLNEPEETIEGGKRVYRLVNDVNETFCLDAYMHWRNLCILTERGGRIAVLNKDRIATDFIYDEILFKYDCMIAIYETKDEFGQPEKVTHIFNEDGMIITSDGEKRVEKIIVDERGTCVKFKNNTEIPLK